MAGALSSDQMFLLFAARNVLGAKHAVYSAMTNCYRGANWNPHSGASEDTRPPLIEAAESAFVWLEDLEKLLLDQLDMKPKDVREFRLRNPKDNLLDHVP